MHIHLSVRGSLVRKLFFAELARTFKVPYTIHLHGCNFEEFWDENLAIGIGVRRIFLGSNSIIVLGKYWAEAISSRLPQLSDKIFVLPNATRVIPAFQKPAGERDLRIIFLGELGERKGTKILIDALNEIVDLPNWRADIAGNGKIKHFKDLVVRLNLQSRITISGWQDSQSVNRMLSEGDVLVLPSFSENLPMVIIEAFAYGLAVVATPVGAIPEVINEGHNGFIVPLGDPKALSEILRKLVTDRPLATSLGLCASLDHAQRYSLDHYISKLEHHWRLCATYKPRRTS